MRWPSRRLSHVQKNRCPRTVPYPAERRRWIRPSPCVLVGGVLFSCGVDRWIRRAAARTDLDGPQAARSRTRPVAAPFPVGVAAAAAAAAVDEFNVTSAPGGGRSHRGRAVGCGGGGDGYDGYGG